MEHVSILENLREIAVITLSVSFAKLVEYLAIKVYTYIDSKHESFLDVD